MEGWGRRPGVLWKFCLQNSGRRERFIVAKQNEVTSIIDAHFIRHFPCLLQAEILKNSGFVREPKRKII
jgi:hypothetical protein